MPVLDTGARDDWSAPVKLNMAAGRQVINWLRSGEPVNCVLTRPASNGCIRASRGAARQRTSPPWPRYSLGDPVLL
jgi:hypothetical protein